MSNHAIANIENPFAKSACIVQLSISSWTARKTLRGEADNNMKRAVHAEKDAGKFLKELIPAKMLAPIRAVEGNARKFHEDNTFAWAGTDRGLPVERFDIYRDGMAKIRQEHSVALDVFCNWYSDRLGVLREQAQRLGETFQETDYPSEDEIRKRFSIRTIFAKFPDNINDFRVDIAKGAAAEMRDLMAESHENAMSEIRKDLIGRIIGRDTEAKGLRKMALKLATYKPKGKADTFRDSLIENVREIVGLVEQLNVHGDPEVAKLCKAARRDLLKNDAATLRENADIRNDTAKKAQALIDRMSKFAA